MKTLNLSVFEKNNVLKKIMSLATVLTSENKLEQNLCRMYLDYSTCQIP